MGRPIEHHGRTTISYHFPILLNIRVGSRPMNTRKRIPDNLFRDEGLAREVEDIWWHHMETSLNMLDKVYGALEQILVFFRGEADLRYAAYTP
jgi:hypothetical protein